MQELLNHFVFYYGFDTVQYFDFLPLKVCFIIIKFSTTDLYNATWQLGVPVEESNKYQ
jgi:hypothetical protein